MTIQSDEGRPGPNMKALVYPSKFANAAKADAIKVVIRNKSAGLCIC